MVGISSFTGSFTDDAAATGRETEVVEITGRERHFLLTSGGRAVTIAEAGPYYVVLLTPPVQPKAPGTER